MTRRMIDSGMWGNENFATLCPMARLFQIGIINHADDQGRLKGNPALLRSTIFPYDDVAVEDVNDWIFSLVCNGTIILYEFECKAYIQLVNWWEYQNLQFASPSDYPAPTLWNDRIRYNAKGGCILTYNWWNTKGESIPDSCDSHGNPGGNPGGRPPGGTNKDQLNTNKDQSSSPLPPSRPEPPMPDDDDGKVKGDRAVFKAWAENIPGMMTPILADSLHALIDECGAPSVLHGIAASVGAGVRTMNYITSCARNHAAGKPPPGKKADGTKPNDMEKSAMLTRAKNAQASIRTAQQFKGYVDPRWQQDIEAAKGLGLL